MGIHGKSYQQIIWGSVSPWCSSRVGRRGSKRRLVVWRPPAAATPVYKPPPQPLGPSGLCTHETHLWSSASRIPVHCSARNDAPRATKLGTAVALPLPMPPSPPTRTNKAQTKTKPKKRNETKRTNERKLEDQRKLYFLWGGGGRIKRVFFFLFSSFFFFFFFVGLSIRLNYP